MPLDATGGSVPPRVEDLFRHLDDLRTDSYEGVGPRPQRVELYRRAVELLGPVVRRVLEEADAAFLDRTGEIGEHGPSQDPDGGWTARWELSWPQQRQATNRRGGDGVAPVQVVAWFAAGFTHPHLSGSLAGHWPLQVTGEADAERQEPIVRAIVEAELHQRIFEGGWTIVPGYTRRSGDGQ
jgi:hypothetical protein